MTSRILAILLLVLQPLVGLAIVAPASVASAACGPVAAVQTAPSCCCAAMMPLAGPDTCPCVASTPTEAPAPTPEPAPTPQRSGEIVTVPAPDATLVAIPAAQARPGCDRSGQPEARSALDRAARRATTGVWRT
ncbi:MAG: hypothetical protein ACF8QF_02995 [Phycisphaerales bacterium]